MRGAAAWQDEVCGSLVRTAYLGRLLCFAPLMVSLPQVGVRRMACVVVLTLLATGTSFMGLRDQSLAEVIVQRPIVASLDAALIAVVVAVHGYGTAADFAVAVTCFVVGLLLGPVWAAPAVATMLLPYAVVVYSTQGLAGLASSDGAVWAMPLVALVLTALGATFQVVFARAAESRMQLEAAYAEKRAAQERAALARELHDSAAKTVQGIGLAARGLALQAEQNPTAVSAIAARIGEASAQATEEMRGVLRTLRVGQSDEPFAVQLRNVCDEGQTRGPRLEIEADPEVVVPEVVAPAMLLVTREAVRNARDHASATTVMVRCEHTKDGVRGMVVDDGAGFAGPVAETVRDAERRGHFGVRGMHERVEELGGWLRVTSAPGEGTTVEWEVPCGGTT